MDKLWRHRYFFDYGGFGAIRKPDSGRIVCNSYIFIYLTKTENWEIFVIIALTKDTIFFKNADFFAKKWWHQLNQGVPGTDR